MTRIAHGGSTMWGLSMHLLLKGYYTPLLLAPRAFLSGFRAVLGVPVSPSLSHSTSAVPRGAGALSKQSKQSALCDLKAVVAVACCMAALAGPRAQASRVPKQRYFKELCCVHL